MHLLFSVFLVVGTLSRKAARHVSLEWSMSVDKKLIDMSNVHDNDITIKFQNTVSAVGNHCLFDAVHLSLHLPNRGAMLHDLLLAVVQDGTAVTAKVPMASFLPVTEEKKAPQTSVFTCLINEEHRQPQIENIAANTSGNPSIQLSFTDETNMPDLSSTFQLLEALVFTPMLLGGAIGEWKDSKTLVIMIDTVYLDAVMEGNNIQTYPLDVIPHLTLSDILS